MKSLRARKLALALLAVSGLTLAVGNVRAQGIISPASGPVNTSMAGASTASPLDAIGANYWNPATISGLSQSEIALGFQFTYPDIYANSQILGVGGSTRSDNGLVMIPSMGLVYKPAEFSRLTLGVGMFVAGGGGVNYPGDPANPIFAPTAPGGNLVLGPSYSNIAFLQVATNLSYQVTDKLSVGGGPILDLVTAQFDPAFFAPADDANGDGVSTFPSATHSRPFWGGGFRAGAYYHVTENVDIGFSYSSPQWIEQFFFHSRDEAGNPRNLTLNLTLPAVYSWGVAYKGIRNLTLASDFRFIDNQNAVLFGTPVVNGGLGWQNVFAVAVGAQYAFSECFSVRAGYLYNTAPIPAPATLFNLQAPAITQNTITAGLSMKLNDTIVSHVTYMYNFVSTLTGPVREVTGTGVTMQTQAHSLLFGMTIKFGSPSCQDNAGAVAASEPPATASAMPRQ